MGIGDLDTHLVHFKTELDTYYVETSLLVGEIVIGSYFLMWRVSISLGNCLKPTLLHFQIINEIVLKLAVWLISILLKKLSLDIGWIIPNSRLHLYAPLFVKEEFRGAG